MQNNHKIVVLIPTYNEADNLPLLVAELWALNLPNLHVLVVDDNSPDGTGLIAAELTQPRAGRLHVLHRPRREGLGRALVAGFRWAQAHGADIIVQMDCDFSHSPQKIPEMLSRLRYADLVVGSRFVPGGDVDRSWGTVHYVLSWFANAVYARVLLNLKVHDATTGFKCWRSDALRSLDFDLLSPGAHSFQLETAYLTEKLGFRIEEVPIVFEDRGLTKARPSWRNRLAAALRVWQIAWRYRNASPVVPLPKHSPPEPRDAR
jgi:dolichol-phosphate mannosyltransferase